MMAKPAGSHTLKLSILRHAKASRDGVALADIDRPLTPRGHTNATAMGQWMSSAGLAPSRILCSNARRTRETLDLVLPQLADKPKIEHLAELYLAGPLLLLKHLHAVKKRDAHILLIGHNPGLHALALELIATGPMERIATLGRKLPTSGLVVIGFDVPAWTDVLAGTGTLVSFTTPKDLE